MADRSRFAKTVTVLAIVFGIGLGLCGLSYVLPSSDEEFHWLSGVSLLMIVLTFLGLVVTLIIWAIKGIMGSSTERTSATQTRFGDSEKELKDRDQLPPE